MTFILAIVSGVFVGVGIKALLAYLGILYFSTISSDRLERDRNELPELVSFVVKKLILIIPIIVGVLLAPWLWLTFIPSLIAIYVAQKKAREVLFQSITLNGGKVITRDECKFIVFSEKHQEYRAIGLDKELGTVFPKSHVNHVESLI